jgi:sulfur transfer protein SufE
MIIIMDKGRIISIVLIAYLLAGAVNAKRILFYEIGTSSQYTIEGDYSKFGDELRKKGFEVASIEKDEITKEKLENYDILIMQNFNKQLTTGEISTIIWFVLQKGRGLMINGGGQGTANQLTIPFGVTVDNGLLIDTSDQIPSLNSRNSFTVDRFIDDPLTITIRRGVTKIGFYKNSGLIRSGSTRCIATGNSDTYSDTGSFSAGSEPCIAAASIFGGGQVVTISSADMFNNKNIGDFNNKNFGMNLVEWLSLSTENVSTENNPRELVLQIKEMKLDNAKLSQQITQLSDDNRDITQKAQECSTQVTECQSKMTEMQDGMIGPFNRSNWAIIVLGACILIAAIVYSKKQGGEVKIKDEDILNELGYELDGGAGQAPKEGEKKVV